MLDPRDDCWNTGAVRAVAISKPFLKFGILHPDHHSAGDDRKCCHSKVHCKSGAETPGQHFAEVRQIYGMAHMRADPIRHQSLLIAAVHLRQSAEQFRAEFLAQTSGNNAGIHVQGLW